MNQFLISLAQFFTKSEQHILRSFMDTQCSENRSPAKETNITVKKYNRVQDKSLQARRQDSTQG